MARARNIKPAIMVNEDLASLPPLTRLLFIYLWMLADREGRLEDRPNRIAVQALPYDRSADVEAMLDTLCNEGFIQRYEAAGVKVIHIVSFPKHQTPHGTEKDSDLPDQNGKLWVHERGKNGYTTGSVSLKDAPVTDVKQSSNDSLTVKEHPDLLIPDSLIPDSLIPNTSPSAKKAKPVAPAYSAEAALIEAGVDQQVAADWLQVRKAKRAKPTKTGIDGVLRNIRKAGMTPDQGIRICCELGWIGFNPEWVSSQQARASPSGPYESGKDKSRRETYAALTGQNHEQRTLIDIN